MSWNPRLEFLSDLFKRFRMRRLMHCGMTAIDIYGSHAAMHQASHAETFEQIRQELKSRIPRHQRLFGVLNLVGWLKTR